MAHDIFISYSSRNATVADAVCARLEAERIRCWYAPRDIETGTNWAASIDTAIRESRALVLIFTDESNASKQVLREINLAANRGLPIIPLRLTAADPIDDLRYYLTGVHWLDAMDEHLDEDIDALCAYCTAVLEAETEAAQRRIEERVRKAKRRRRLRVLLGCAAAVALAVGGVALYRHIQSGHVVVGYSSPKEVRPLTFTAMDRAEAGDLVGFGTFEQDGDPDNGAEVIAWKVLERDEDSLLMISRYGLVCMPFNASEDTACTWDDSAPRAWLNGEFRGQAFTAREARRLVRESRESDANPIYDTDPGAATEDDVRLLTLTEFNRLGLSEDEDTSKATLPTGESCGWWMGTPGCSGWRTVVVEKYSRTATSYGVFNGDGEKAVRPVVRVRVPRHKRPVEAEAPTAIAAAVPEMPFETVTFGHYEQDGDLENGDEPIHWLVLERDGDETLLISRDILDAREYYCRSQTPEERESEDQPSISLLEALLGTHKATEPPNNAPWSASTLRLWLNGEFLNAAFTASERTAIVESPTEAEVNPRYKTPGDDTVTDRIRLPGIGEIRTCFGSAPPVAKPTAYALSQGVNAATWWLRTPGGSANMLMCVDGDGTVDERGAFIEVDGELNFLGIRPMLRCDLSRLNREAADVEETPRISVSLAGTLRFGLWEQDDDLENGPEPIEWQVLDWDGDRLLIVSKELLESRLFGTAGGGGFQTWEISGLRRWLNGPFLQGAFSAAERQCIQITDVRETRHDSRGDAGNDTRDYVFLLNAQEAERYYPRPEERYAAPTVHAWHVHDLYNTRYHLWWLRDGNIENSLVDESGRISQTEISTVTRWKNFVRPAMWIEVDEKPSTIQDVLSKLWNWTGEEG